MESLVIWVQRCKFVTSGEVEPSSMERTLGKEESERDTTT